VIGPLPPIEIAPTMHAVSDSPRRIHVVGASLAALAAALLIAGSWSSSWWRGEEGGLVFSAGLRFVEMCGEGGCREAATATIGGAGWMRIGIGAFTAGMVGAALLLASIARVLTRPGRRSALPGAATLACVAAAILGVAFAMLAPAEVTSLELGGAVFAYFAGAALGAGSSAGLLSARAGEPTA
jgi:hypothetical protein